MATLHTVPSQPRPDILAAVQTLCAQAASTVVMVGVGAKILAERARTELAATGAKPEKLVLGGEDRDMTILFSDVRGFTAISELYKDDPQGLTSLMHRLLTPLTNVIVGQEGTIDKYIGDAVMGFWNAPLLVPQHELKACAAALDMIDRVVVLNRERQEEAKAAGQAFLPLRIGIDINTVRCLVGNLGSDLRFN